MNWIRNPLTGSVHADLPGGVTANIEVSPIPSPEPFQAWYGVRGERRLVGNFATLVEAKVILEDVHASTVRDARILSEAR